MYYALGMVCCGSCTFHIVPVRIYAMLVAVWRALMVGTASQAVENDFSQARSLLSDTSFKRSMKVYHGTLIFCHGTGFVAQ